MAQWKRLRLVCSNFNADLQPGLTCQAHGIRAVIGLSTVSRGLRHRRNQFLGQRPLLAASCHCGSLMPLHHSMVEALPLKSSREES